MKIFNHIGEKIGEWSVIDGVKIEGVYKYILQCSCGNKKFTTSSHFFRATASPCSQCTSKKCIENKIGEKNGRLTIIAYKKFYKRHGILVLCKCGNKIEMKNYKQFLKQKSCFLCKFGYFPGKEVNGITLIRRIKGTIWEKKCFCGKIFTGYARKIHCGCKTINKYDNLAIKKIGLKYENLTVKKVLPRKNSHIQLLVKCKCGNKMICDNGHEFRSKSCGCVTNVPVGEQHSNATLKNCEVVSIRELYKSGAYTLEEISSMFDKKKNYISKIINGSIWKHV